MKKGVKLVCVGLAMAVVIPTMLAVSCAQPAPEPTEVIKWRFTTVMAGVASLPAQAYVDLASRIYENTGGRLDISVHWVGELGYNPIEHVRIVQDGLVEMADAPASIVAYDIPWMGLDGLPMLMETNEEKLIQLDEMRPMLEEALAERNCVLLAQYPLCMTRELGMFTNKEIKSADDLEGFKMRFFTPQQEALFVKQLGCVPVHTTIAEVVSAMQTGVIEGEITNVAAIDMHRLGDCAKYIYKLWPVATQDAIICSKAAFDALPEDIQKILMDTAADFEKERYAASVSPKYDNAWRELAAKYDMVIIESVPADVQAKLEAGNQSVWDEWLAESGPKGKQVLDLVQAALREYRQSK